MSHISSSAFSDTKAHYDLLDGLRGVAALMVIWYHIFEGYAFAGGSIIETFNHGYLAVDFFFILSGFVIGYAYDDRWGRNLTMKNFFKRRLIRLHPMVIMGAVLGAITFCLQGCVQWDGTHIALSMIMLSLLCTIFFIPAMPGAGYEVRGNGEMFPLNGPCWSLFFEYLGNILYALFIHRLSNKALAVLTILFAFALARWQTNRLIKPINELDLERPLDSDIYEELSPLLEAMDRQNREKEAVANMRKEFSANVSHELKTPLTSMVGYIELIKREELSDIVRDYVDVISERAEKLKEMINSLFNLAKASSGNVELHPEPFEVNRMIEQIFADMDDRIKESHLEFVTDLTKEDTQLISDNSYFYRICQNLIENALKYSAKGTRVFVKTKLLQSEGKEEVWLEVTNTSGYPMDFTKEDIIERFARGDKARTGDGNGLGLAIVSTYAKALGGEFDILIDCDQFKACLKFPKKTI